MEEKRIVAGNLAFVVKELHTNLGDGVSVDILARRAERDVSMIRLDWSPDKPHYHYNPGAENSKVVPLDPAAISDSMDWFLARVSDRLPFMIHRAGYPDVAGNINADELVHALPDVKRTAQIFVENVMRGQTSNKAD